MNNLVTISLYGALILGDLLLVRVLLLENRAEGAVARTAAWLFFMGAGIAGLVADDAMRGHHPVVAIVAGICTGLALASLTRFRATVHGPRADVHATPR